MLALATLNGCGAEHKSAEAPARAVQTAVVSSASDGATTVYSGAVVGRYEGQLSFRTGGIMISRLVDVGQPVRAGQILARLNPGDQALAFESAEAQVTAAQAAADEQRVDLSRASKLLAQGFISPAEFGRQSSGAMQAAAQLVSARVQRASADRQMGYTVLRAVRSGVVTAVNADTGSVVAAGQTVVTVADPREVEVAISIPEGEVLAFRRAHLQVRLWTAPDKPLPGHLRLLAQAASSVTRTFDARVSFVPPQTGAVLGTTAEVAAKIDDKAAMIRVPLAAVSQRGGKAAVWLVGGNPMRAQPRAVVIDHVENNAVVIRNGLRPGERIITAGVHLLTPGQAVALAPMAGPAT